MLGSDTLKGGIGVSGSDEILMSNNGIMSRLECLVIQNANGVAL
jgi:hypothetical protein